MVNGSHMRVGLGEWGNNPMFPQQGGAVKRPSPEPAGVDTIQGGPMAKTVAKKPKVQKKKKKRDPNEPQK